jgi:hypothetical protein
MHTRKSLLTGLLIGALSATGADAQFRRGILSESTEITVYPVDLPALLLPAGNVQVEVRNASGASARIVERLNDLLGRQLGDNDSRLTVVDKGADIIVAVTLVDWKESRRNSTKYVSEQRQVGTRQVKDKNGNYKTEPIYEYGRNKPSVVIDASAGLRVEVRRGRSAPIADETVRHTLHEEHLADAGPPTRDAVEDMLIDNVVQKGAGRISPGRVATRVLLARSDEVDRLNGMAQNRRWNDWYNAVTALKPHSDKKRDSYRLHNLAVAHEAIAYESTSPEDWATRLNLASGLIQQALAQNPKEKYIIESEARIRGSASRYQQLTAMYREVKATAPPPPPPPAPKAAPTPAPSAPTTPAPPPSTAPTAKPTTTPAPPPAPKRTAPAPRPAQPDLEIATPPKASPRSATMTNRDVIDLRAAGLDDDNLLAAIADAKSVNFDLSPAGLKALLTAKVSNRVITAMRGRAK